MTRQMTRMMENCNRTMEERRAKPGLREDAEGADPARLIQISLRAGS